MASQEESQRSLAAYLHAKGRLQMSSRKPTSSSPVSPSRPPLHASKPWGSPKLPPDTAARTAPRTLHYGQLGSDLRQARSPSSLLGPLRPAATSAQGRAAAWQPHTPPPAAVRSLASPEQMRATRGRSGALAWDTSSFLPQATTRQFLSRTLPMPALSPFTPIPHQPSASDTWMNASSLDAHARYAMMQRQIKHEQQQKLQLQQVEHLAAARTSDAAQQDSIVSAREPMERHANSESAATPSRAVSGVTSGAHVPLSSGAPAATPPISNLLAKPQTLEEQLSLAVLKMMKLECQKQSALAARSHPLQQEDCSDESEEEKELPALSRTPAPHAGSTNKEESGVNMQPSRSWDTDSLTATSTAATEHNANWIGTEPKTATACAATSTTSAFSAASISTPTIARAVPRQAGDHTSASSSGLADSAADADYFQITDRQGGGLVLGTGAAVGTATSAAAATRFPSRYDMEDLGFILKRPEARARASVSPLQRTPPASSMTSSPDALRGLTKSGPAAPRQRATALRASPILSGQPMAGPAWLSHKPSVSVCSSKYPTLQPSSSRVASYSSATAPAPPAHGLAGTQGGRPASALQPVTTWQARAAHGLAVAKERAASAAQLRMAGAAQAHPLSPVKVQATGNIRLHAAPVHDEGRDPLKAAAAGNQPLPSQSRPGTKPTMGADAAGRWDVSRRVGAREILSLVHQPLGPAARHKSSKVAAAVEDALESAAAALESVGDSTALNPRFGTQQRSEPAAAVSARRGAAPSGVPAMGRPSPASVPEQTPHQYGQAIASRMYRGTSSPTSAPASTSAAVSSQRAGLEGSASPSPGHVVPHPMPSSRSTGISSSGRKTVGGVQPGQRLGATPAGRRGTDGIGLGGKAGYAARHVEQQQSQQQQQQQQAQRHGSAQSGSEGGVGGGMGDSYASKRAVQQLTVETALSPIHLLSSPDRSGGEGVPRSSLAEVRYPIRHEAESATRPATGSCSNSSISLVGGAGSRGKRSSWSRRSRDGANPGVSPEDADDVLVGTSYVEGAEWGPDAGRSGLQLPAWDGSYDPHQLPSARASSVSPPGLRLQHPNLASRLLRGMGEAGRRGPPAGRRLRAPQVALQLSQSAGGGPQETISTPHSQFHMYFMPEALHQEDGLLSPSTSVVGMKRLPEQLGGGRDPVLWPSPASHVQDANEPNSFPDRQSSFSPTISRSASLWPPSPLGRQAIQGMPDPDPPHSMDPRGGAPWPGAAMAAAGGRGDPLRDSLLSDGGFSTLSMPSGEDAYNPHASLATEAHPGRRSQGGSRPPTAGGLQNGGSGAVQVALEFFRRSQVRVQDAAEASHQGESGGYLDPSSSMVGLRRCTAPQAAAEPLTPEGRPCGPLGILSSWDGRSGDSSLSLTTSFSATSPKRVALRAIDESELRKIEEGLRQAQASLASSQTFEPASRFGAGRPAAVGTAFVPARDLASQLNIEGGANGSAAPDAAAASPLSAAELSRFSSPTEALKRVLELLKLLQARRSTVPIGLPSGTAPVAASPSSSAYSSLHAMQQGLDASDGSSSLHGCEAGLFQLSMPPSALTMSPAAELAKRVQDQPLQAATDHASPVVQDKDRIQAAGKLPFGPVLEPLPLYLRSRSQPGGKALSPAITAAPWSSKEGLPPVLAARQERYAHGEELSARSDDGGQSQDGAVDPAEEGMHSREEPSEGISAAVEAPGTAATATTVHGASVPLPERGSKAISRHEAVEKGAAPLHSPETSFNQSAAESAAAASMAAVVSPFTAGGSHAVGEGVWGSLSYSKSQSLQVSVLPADRRLSFSADPTSKPRGQEGSGRGSFLPADNRACPRVASVRYARQPALWRDEQVGDPGPSHNALSTSTHGAPGSAVACGRATGAGGTYTPNSLLGVTQEEIQLMTSLCSQSRTSSLPHEGLSMDCEAVGGPGRESNSLDNSPRGADLASQNRQLRSPRSPPLPGPSLNCARRPSLLSYNDGGSQNAPAAAPDPPGPSRWSRFSGSWRQIVPSCEVGSSSSSSAMASKGDGGRLIEVGPASDCPAAPVIPTALYGGHRRQDAHEPHGHPASSMMAGGLIIRNKRRHAEQQHQPIDFHHHRDQPCQESQPEPLLGRRRPLLPRTRHSGDSPRRRGRRRDVTVAQIALLHDCYVRQLLAHGIYVAVAGVAGGTLAHATFAEKDRVTYLDQ